MAKTGPVSHHRWKRVLTLAAALSAAACTKNPDATAASAPQTLAQKAPASAPAPAKPAPSAPATGAGSPLAGIPGMDFSSLPEPAQRELVTVLSDEFCYCGCPHTLGACLKTHTPCKHAKRMASLAARQVADGSSGNEVIVGLSRYYASFREPRAALKVDPRMCMGDANAPVTMVEFSDFECPFCAKARPLLEEFARKHSAQVRFCYAPFPLPMHANAVPAGQAALWARDQGKFWQMHDALFVNQANLSPAALPGIANSIGLPGAKLAEALKAGTYAKELDEYKAQGMAARLRGTPTLFLNGRVYPLDFLGLDEAELAHSVEDEIEWKANNNAWAAD
ncbi:thioredoxin domain-containing protein [Myxococcaceae bacterium GXIMD 01537]